MNGRRLTTPLTIVLLLTGCTAGFAPAPMDEVPFRERAQTQTQEGVTVTTAVPSAAETRQLFGVGLYSRNIQPVWIEIENNTDDWIAFLPASLDLDYRSPIEVASLNRSTDAREQAEQYFFEQSVNQHIAPGGTRTGFVFTNLDEGTKAFNVDVVADENNWRFTFFVPVPGLKIDHYEIDIDELYAPEDIINYTDPDEFIAALEALPCCTVDKKGEDQGDPLNIVLIGDTADIYYAVLRAGWDETETVNAISGWKTVMSFLTGGEYRYSPVSSLYVYDRKQDVALQRIRDNIHERNHFRLWLAPMTYGGHAVWIGQISRDIGVRFTTRTITTHKIDPDVDETREYLLENLAYRQVLDKFAYVEGVGAAPVDEPRGNLTGDPYFTDGHRLVMWIGHNPTDLQDIEFEAWAEPLR